MSAATSRQALNADVDVLPDQLVASASSSALHHLAALPGPAPDACGPDCAAAEAAAHQDQGLQGLQGGLQGLQGGPQAPPCAVHSAPGCRRRF